jgi:hypothetical protein
MTANRPTPRPGVLDIAPYVPGKSSAPGVDKVIKLSSNESPLGPSPKAIDAYRAGVPHLEDYPDGSVSELRTAIGRAFGLDPARLVCGAGSDDLLNLLAHAYLRDGDEVIYSEHGFLMYPIYALGHGGKPVKVPEKNYTADIDAMIGRDGPFALLSQTTLSMDEWAELREHAEATFPDIWMPNRSDLCFATTNRQAALREIAAKADAVVVIGSANSSNTVALATVAAASGCTRVVRVNGADELPDDLEGIIGVTAGASAPERLVVEVIERLAPVRGVSLVKVTDEDEYFPPPPELRELLRRLESEEGGGALSLDDDRSISAAQVLEDLGSR